MIRYVACPGEDCDAKVKLGGDEDVRTASFCCVPCWDHTWALISDADYDPKDRPGHSKGCVDRQAARAGQECEDVEYTITTKAPVT